MRHQLKRAKRREKLLRRRLAGIFLLLLLAACVAVLIWAFAPKGEREGKEPEKKSFHGTTISVYFTQEDVVKTVDLEQYLEGVVAAEMPAEFESEALKAQAVAARTFIVQRALSNSKDPAGPHKGADVCDNPSHCKAHKDQSAYSEEFVAKYWSKLRSAVQDTRGQILVYNGEPISAVFFSMSGGKTENSKDVWGGDLPYLKSVDSPADANAPNFETTVTVSVDEYRRNIQEKFPEADFLAYPLFEEIQRSEGGSVTTLLAGGVSIKGTEMRTLFDLRSANFTLSSDGDTVVFDVKGYGHGVGMSQWGANFLAKDGKTYEEILKTYYSDVELSHLTP